MEQIDLNGTTMADWKFIADGESVLLFAHGNVTNIVCKTAGKEPWGFRLEDGQTYGGYDSQPEALEAYKEFCRNL